MGLRGSLKGTTKVRLTDSDKEDIRRMTLEGKGTAEIAGWIGCSDTTVRKYRNQMGLTCTFVPERFWTDEDTATLVDMVAEKRSSVEIAEILGRTPSSVNIKASKLRKAGHVAYRNINCAHPGKARISPITEYDQQ